MSSIVGNLMPVCAREPDPELWLIYDHLQEWALLAGNKLPMNGNSSAGAAKVIALYLSYLRNRKLAREIGRIIERHTPDFHLAAAV